MLPLERRMPTSGLHITINNIQRRTTYHRRSYDRLINTLPPRSMHRSCTVDRRLAKRGVKRSASQRWRPHPQLIRHVAGQMHSRARIDNASEEEPEEVSVERPACRGKVSQTDNIRPPERPITTHSSVPSIGSPRGLGARSTHSSQCSSGIQLPLNRDR